MDWIDKVAQHLPVQQNKWAYGTAGFRGLASRMDSVCYRAALVALMRATQAGKNTGCMLTASHNHKDDNGLKLIDWNGEMLAGEWESIAEEFVNSDNFAQLLKERFESSPNGRVYIACDNRPSSPSLISIIQQAIENAGGKVVNYGELTTPQLHYLVYLSNKTSSTPSEIDYTQHFSTHFETLINAPPLQTTGLYQPGLIVDCSGGVGASKIRAFSSLLNLTLRNTDKNMLNEGCGAEHVQKTQTLPSNFTGQEPKCASFDGDADRLVYFKGTAIFGGDKLMALYLRALYGLFAREGVHAEIGVVTTGYSNSSAIEYLTSMAVIYI